VLVLTGNRIAERETTNPLDFIGKFMQRFRARRPAACRASAAAWSAASATTPCATSKPA
jgi:hypothetical protein